MSVTSSLPIGGRPGGCGCRHRAAISVRCQRDNVAGVTIRWMRKTLLGGKNSPVELRKPDRQEQVPSHAWGS
ncbi:hypothetical protein DMH04_30715 [Kibdelosporangium aridum]|uniref:Uncharacterized protein n=1 Tax=Kibdelosporangium aridum TaxID=2030 RepID=A0A428Z2Q9_KIBAR|nr:hypothetical protein DMH04_30715 [Kibdelosporangium aridum]